MSTKRLITALAAAAIGLAVLSGCAPTADPTPSTSSTPSPTATSAGPVDPPKDEEEAITAAESVLKKWFATRGEVNAGGGKDTDRLKELSTGRALERVLADADQVANGPQLNKDGVNIDGPVKTEGAIKIEVKSSYGQEWKGVPNGLVTVQACQDASEYKIWASDGSEAMARPQERDLFDYQVVYDSDAKAWLVYELTSLGQTC